MLVTHGPLQTCPGAPECSPERMAFLGRVSWVITRWANIARTFVQSPPDREAGCAETTAPSRPDKLFRPARTHGTAQARLRAGRSSKKSCIVEPQAAATPSMGYMKYLSTVTDVLSPVKLGRSPVGWYRGYDARWQMYLQGPAALASLTDCSRTCPYMCPWRSARHHVMAFSSNRCTTWETLHYRSRLVCSHYTC